jgi:hypothetical protein
MSEHSIWRKLLLHQSLASSSARNLFPDQAAFYRAENRRWELATTHWNLPIDLVGIKLSE